MVWCGGSQGVRQGSQSMLRIVAVRGPKAPQPRRWCGTWGTGSPECAGHRHPAPHGGTRRCRPTILYGLPIWFVGRDLCVPPLVRCIGYGFAGMCRSSSPRTARRHTQVPPYNPVRTAQMVRRAGPMCPAAGAGSPQYTGERHPRAAPQTTAPLTRMRHRRRAWGRTPPAPPARRQRFPACRCRIGRPRAAV